MRTLPTITVLTIAMALACVPSGHGSTPLAAQELRFSPDRSGISATVRSGGWLGIQITNEAWAPGSTGAGTWIIAGVVEDSPADIAGVEEGDEILSVNGTPISDDVLEELTSGLQAGDEVAIRLRRGSRTLDLALVAQSRPIMVVRRSGSPQAVAIRGDSILLRMLGAMDSIRPGLRFDLEEPPVKMRGDTVRIWRFFGDSLQGSPFTFRSDTLRMEPFTFRGDSVRGGPFTWRHGPTDAEFFRAMPLPFPDAFVRPFEGERGPAAIYWSGQRVVAGAELTPVNEGLSTYFGVDRGLLAVEVVPGSFCMTRGCGPET